ncbi:(2Fe-2S)-binding protein [Parasulfitobacter algicola]|uniref:(2Fe-2S)-binding protein n=1 Tax=Parasulfitobacter algicola TaxID=2614809 RepID=A0ABX2IUB1_9RHOB|nr:(2Fe-2S)-binding protein [Sulfitobacter algicola]NSX53964.1 (2Fe-2S)-binding protein [Sulfitobacter algicola]
MSISFTVNGTPRTTDTDPAKPLLWVIRDELKLTGTKYGCGVAQCGACTVMIDGVASRSCVTPVDSVEGAEITTIEGLSGPEAAAVQAAWTEIEVPQCGYCQSGQIMTATSFLTETQNPTDEDIAFAMDGNLCRCATYTRIRAAVRKAADSLEA